MGKLKIKKPKNQRSLIPAPLNITGFTMEQASRQTGVRIESLKAYLDSKEQEIREQTVKEFQEKAVESRRLYCCGKYFNFCYCNQESMGIQESKPEFH